MGRTVNRRPQLVETPSSKAIATSYFHQNEWKGICEDKNTFGVDQNTFEACENVYVNRDNFLCNRPGLNDELLKDEQSNKFNDTDYSEYKVYSTKSYVIYYGQRELEGVFVDDCKIIDINKSAIQFHKLYVPTIEDGAFILYEPELYFYEIGNTLFAFGKNNLYRLNIDLTLNEYSLVFAKTNVYTPDKEDLLNLMSPSSYTLSDKMSVYGNAGDNVLSLTDVLLNPVRYNDSDLKITSKLNNFSEQFVTDWPYDVENLKYAAISKISSAPSEAKKIFIDNGNKYFTYNSVFKTSLRVNGDNVEVTILLYCYDENGDLLQKGTNGYTFRYVFTFPHQNYTTLVVNDHWTCCSYKDENLLIFALSSKRKNALNLNRLFMNLLVFDYSNGLRDMVCVSTRTNSSIFSYDEYLCSVIENTNYSSVEDRFAISTIEHRNVLYGFNIYYPNTSNNNTLIKRNKIIDVDVARYIAPLYRANFKAFYLDEGIGIGIPNITIAAKSNTSDNALVIKINRNDVFTKELSGSYRGCVRESENIYVYHNVNDVLYKYDCETDETVEVGKSLFPKLDSQSYATNLTYSTYCASFKYDEPLKTFDTISLSPGTSIVDVAFSGDTFYVLTNFSEVHSNEQPVSDAPLYTLNINKAYNYVMPIPTLIRPIGSNSFLYFVDDTSYILQVRYNNEILQLYIPEGKENRYYDTVIDAEQTSDKSLAVIGNSVIYSVVDTGEVDDKLLPIFQYIQSKLNLRVIPDSDSIIAYNSSTLLMPTYNGIAAVNYSQLISVEEQTVNYITDNIMTHWLKFVATQEGRLKTCNHNYYLFVYHIGRNDLYMFDYRTNTWWYWTFDKNIKLLHTIGLYCFVVFEDNTLHYFDEKVLDAQWSVTSQKLFLGNNTNYKQIRRFTVHTVGEKSKGYSYASGDGDNVMTLQFTNYRKRMYENDDETFNFNVDFVRTYVIRLNYPKVYEFQYKLSSDKTNLKPLALTGITIEYKIGGKVR